MNLNASESVFPATPAPDFPRVPWRRSPLLLLGYALAIVLLTWPWLSTPVTHLFDHWDPPFHAWKLTFAARTLLSGRILPAFGNTNLYYPHSGAFFYEALHWPQAVFAAPLLALGLPEIVVYHITLVFFWALSGVLFWAWLRVLGLRGPFAAAGGLFFTVIPYRMSYAVEFNMQLTFGLPLLLFALVRFFQRPGFRYACLAAAAWWLQATSELYQAIFVLFAFPFWAVPFLARDPGLFRSFRRFWLPFAAAGALCAALSLPFLLPYAKTLGDGSLIRSLSEMRRHALEPFSYAVSWGRLRFLPLPHARHDEMSVFPTLSLAALALWGIFSCLPAARRRNVTIVFGVLAALAAVFAVPLHFAGGAGNVFAEIVSWLLLAAVFASLPWLCRRDRTIPRAACIGVGAAALFGLTMSFGPNLLDSGTGATAPNRLFDLLHAATPALAGFRVVSRFAVFPMLAVCTAGAVGLQHAAERLERRPAALRTVLAVVFFAVFFGECLHADPVRMRRIREPSDSAALAAFDALPGPAVLAIVPMGERKLDSEHMLTIERHDRLGVWAWGGTYPDFTMNLKNALDPYAGNAAKAIALLRELWPEPYVLEDRRPFPGLIPADYAEYFGPLATVVAEDPEFRLFRLAPDLTPSAEAIRLVRIDFASAKPRAVFTLSAPAPARVWLDFNGVPVAAFEATADPTTFTADIPAGLLVHHLPQRYRFHAEGDAPFVLADFHLEALPEGESGAVRPSGPIPELPWLHTLPELPDDATVLDVRYPGGVTLRGVSLLSATPRPSRESGLILPVYPIRLYFRFREDDEIPPKILLAPGYAREGSIVYKYPVTLRSVIDANAFPFARDRIVVADVELPVLELFTSGETFTLALDVLTTSGQRLAGRAADGGKVRHLMLPFSVVIP